MHVVCKSTNQIAKTYIPYIKLAGREKCFILIMRKGWGYSLFPIDLRHARTQVRNANMYRREERLHNFKVYVPERGSLGTRLERGYSISFPGSGSGAGRLRRFHQWSGDRKSELASAVLIGLEFAVISCYFIISNSGVVVASNILIYQSQK